MKKILLVVAVLVSAFSMAQEKITEGIITTKQTVSSTDEQMNMQLAMMGELVSTTYFKEGKARTEMNNPMTGNLVNIMDTSTKEMIVFMDNPMVGKKYINQSLDNKVDENTTVEETKEVKKVLGYDCKKYIVKTKAQGAEMSVILYVTDSLINYNAQTMFGGKIKGMPLYTEVKMMRMGAELTRKSEVTEIKKEKVADDKFDMSIPEGYEKMDQAMMSGGM